MTAQASLDQDSPQLCLVTRVQMNAKKTLKRAKPNWQPSLEAGISFCTYIEGVYIDTHIYILYIYILYIYTVYIYIYIYTVYIYCIYIYCIYIYCIYIYIYTIYILSIYIYIHMCINMYNSQPTRTDPYSHGRLPNTSDSRGAWNDVKSSG